MTKREFETSLLANETIEATIAFVDICGFTSITENEPADTVVVMLNRYFDLMVKEIIAQGGYVDKFIGDAVLAVFRGEFHLDRAIDACLAIRKKIEDLPRENLSISFMPKVTIGINGGEMICGNIGSSTLRRLDYTVIGDVVNTAERLQEAAEPNQILITETSFQKIRESFICRKVNSIPLKENTRPLDIYEVLS
jgi:class 3 adenylate cyclase